MLSHAFSLRCNGCGCRSADLQCLNGICLLFTADYKYPCGDLWVIDVRDRLVFRFLNTQDRIESEFRFEFGGV